MKDKKTKKSVTVALHPGYDTDKAEELAQFEEVKKMADAAGMNQDDIRELNKATNRMLRDVKNLMLEAKMSMIRQDGHN